MSAFYLLEIKIAHFHYERLNFFINDTERRFPNDNQEAVEEFKIFYSRAENLSFLGPNKAERFFMGFRHTKCTFRNPLFHQLFQKCFIPFSPTNLTSQKHTQFPIPSNRQTVRSLFSGPSLLPSELMLVSPFSFFTFFSFRERKL